MKTCSHFYSFFTESNDNWVFAISNFPVHRFVIESRDTMILQASLCAVGSDADALWSYLQRPIINGASRNAACLVPAAKYLNQQYRLSSPSQHDYSHCLYGSMRLYYVKELISWTGMLIRISQSSFLFQSSAQAFCERIHLDRKIAVYLRERPEIQYVFYSCWQRLGLGQCLRIFLEGLRIRLFNYVLKLITVGLYLFRAIYDDPRKTTW